MLEDDREEEAYFAVRRRGGQPRRALKATHSTEPQAPTMLVCPWPAQVRNHILARWRGDVTQFLTQEEAATKIMPRHRCAGWDKVDVGWWGGGAGDVGREGVGTSSGQAVLGVGTCSPQCTNCGYARKTAGGMCESL